MLFALGGFCHVLLRDKIALPSTFVVVTVTAIFGQSSALSGYANKTLSIAYSFSVDKERATHTDSLVYIIRVWNDPLQADTLREVEANFTLPRLANNRFALKLASFRYTGPFPTLIDSVAGTVTWHLGDIIRRPRPAASDTTNLLFSFQIADLSEFSLTCGENPLTAEANVSFLDSDDHRISPGTPRAVTSTLILTPDLVAGEIFNNLDAIQRGDTLILNYAYQNAGNVGRAGTLCLRLPAGLDARTMSVLPDSVALTILAPDSVCLALGVVPAGATQTITLRLPVDQNLPPEIDSLCTAAEIRTDCDIGPNNNRYPLHCVALAPLDLLEVNKRAVADCTRVGDTLIYSIAFANLSSAVTAWNVTVTDSLPDGVELVSASSPFRLVNRVVSWHYSRLLPAAADSVALSVRILPDLFEESIGELACNGLDLWNTVSISSTAADGSSSPESPLAQANNRSSIAVFVRPPDDLPRLSVASIRLIDSNDNSCLDPGERIRALIEIVNSNSRGLLAQDIRFINPRAVLGPTSWPLTLTQLSPATLAPNDTAVATFEFTIAANVFSVDTVSFFGDVTATHFCPQSLSGSMIQAPRFCPTPEVRLTLVDLNDLPGDRDGYASEGEALQAIVSWENTGPVRADSVEVNIAISPAGFELLSSNQTTPAASRFVILSGLEPGQQDSLMMTLRYEVLSPLDRFVTLSSFLQVSAFAVPSPLLRDQLEVKQECFARPNPFIPSRHPDGVRFAANDGQAVEIFDTRGNLVRSLTTSHTWDGRDSRGQACEAGLYLWTIDRNCRGTIVVVR